MVRGFLDQVFFGNSVEDYLWSFAVLVGGIFILWIIKSFVLHRMKVHAARTETTLDDIVIHIIESRVMILLDVGVLYIAIQHLKFSATVDKAIRVLGVVVLTVIGIRLLMALIKYYFENYFLREQEPLKQQSLRRLFPVIKVVVWAAGIAFLLDNLGFRISTVIAGLGIGGIAVALAAQAILGDLFSYFSIVMDRPFEIGDFIIVDEYMGTVEYTGIKTTRIRSLSGEQLVFSNSNLTSSRIRNYKRMEKRRVVFRLGVTYDTPLEKLKEIPEIIKSIVKELEDAVVDRVHFFQYGAYSLDYEVVYYVLSGDYNKYMDIQQHINFRVGEEFAKREIEFAYPTQTLIIAAGDGTDKLREKLS